MASILEVGSVIRSYSVLKVIRRTGFEAVYLVEEGSQSTENRLLREFTPPKGVSVSDVGAAFESELATYRSLKHPQFQQLKDFFWESDRFFLVMSDVQGETYQNCLKSHPPLTEPEIVELLKKILPALSYLHNQNIIHGNISPSNLVLRNSDSLPILTNFQLIRKIEQELKIETTDHQFLDQVTLIKPEILASQSTIKGDLYALAITIVILLTGKEIPDLFKPNTQVCEWEQWKLVSDQLTDLLNRMLAVEVGDRFPSADAILFALNSSFPTATPLSPTVINSYSPTQIPLKTIPSTALGLFKNTTENTQIQTETKQDKDRTWIFALIIGILLTLVGVLAVMLVKGQPRTQTATVTPSPANEIVQNTPPPEPPKPVALTQTEALSVINSYMQAKSQIFAPPFDRQLTGQLTTGTIYKDIIKPDGSIDWLRENNAYYAFGDRQIYPLGYFTSSGDFAQIDVSIREKYYYYEEGKLQVSDMVNKSYRYTLKRENGTWKLSERDTL